MSWAFPCGSGFKLQSFVRASQKGFSLQSLTQKKVKNKTRILNLQLKKNVL